MSAFIDNVAGFLDAVRESSPPVEVEHAPIPCDECGKLATVTAIAGCESHVYSAFLCRDCASFAHASNQYYWDFACECWKLRCACQEGGH